MFDPAEFFIRLIRRCTAEVLFKVFRFGRTRTYAGYSYTRLYFKLKRETLASQKREA